MVNVKSEICRNIFLSASSLMAYQNFLRKLPQRTTHAEVNAFSAGANAAAAGAPPDHDPKASAVVDEVTEEFSRAAAAAAAKPTRTGPKVGRNDPCPCGSGKKYKQCCGR